MFIFKFFSFFLGKFLNFFLGKLLKKFFSWGTFEKVPQTPQNFHSNF